MQKKCYEYYSNHPVGSIKLCMKGVRFEIICLPPSRGPQHHHLQSLSNICKQSCQL